MTRTIEDLIGTFYAAFSGKPELLDDIIADDWDDIPLGPGQAPGRAGAAPLIEGVGEAFSDFRIVVHQIVDGRGPDGNGFVGVRGAVREDRGEGQEHAAAVPRPAVPPADPRSDSASPSGPAAVLGLQDRCRSRDSALTAHRSRRF
ncbi:hypothetical protein AB0P07_34585 [Streptomyces sp. NPDC085944]|uniref:hypothetical protein n=1 Tax=Streptomyces sp. NPDC085944 TaxID=3154962 RepID=UPI003423815F